MPNPAFKVRPKPIQAKRAFGTYAKDMNFVSLPANKHPSEAMELVWSNNAKEETGEISFINAATVLSVVKEYGKYTGTILEKTAEKHPMHKPFERLEWCPEATGEISQSAVTNILEVFPKSFNDALVAPCHLKVKMDH